MRSIILGTGAKHTSPAITAVDNINGEGRREKSQFDPTVRRACTNTQAKLSAAVLLLTLVSIVLKGSPSIAVTRI
jgi:hypothetical protein